jgi:hypothetical protein
MEWSVQHSIHSRYEPENVKLIQGQLYLTCPSCHGNMVLSPEKEGVTISSLIEGHGHVVTCKHCGNLMKIAGNPYEWYMTFAFQPPVRGVKTFDWPVVRKGFQMCSHCGQGAMHVRFIETALHAFIGPLCETCLDAFFASTQSDVLHPFHKGFDHCIRTIPVSILVNRPVLYYSHGQAVGQCFRCLRAVPIPLESLDALSPYEEDHLDRVIVECPACQESNTVAIREAGTTLWTQPYGDH